MICYSQPTLLRQERCFQIVQPLNLWSPKSPDKNLPWGVLKLVVEIGGPICCPKKIKKSQWFQHWSFGWRGPINKQIALPNFKLLHCYRKKTFGHLTKPTNVVLFSSLPMAVDCRWRSLLHELTQATMTTGRRSFFGVGGYVVLFLFFTWHFGEGFFWDRNSSSCIFGFSGWWWSQLCFLCLFFNFPPLLKERIQFDDWLIFFNWVAQPSASWRSLDVTVRFDDWLFGSRLQPAATHPRFTNFLVKHGRFHTVITSTMTIGWGYGRKARFNIVSRARRSEFEAKIWVTVMMLMCWKTDPHIIGLYHVGLYHVGAPNTIATWKVWKTCLVSPFGRFVPFAN